MMVMAPIKKSTMAAIFILFRVFARNHRTIPKIRHIIARAGKYIFLISTPSSPVLSSVSYMTPAHRIAGSFELSPDNQASEMGQIGWDARLNVIIC
jgi:hypothetical protein